MSSPWYRGFVSIVGAAALVVCLLVTESSATSTPTSSFVPEHRMLNARTTSLSGYAGPVASKALPAGKLFVAEVSGTFSYYARKQWAHPSGKWTTVCGTPHKGPLGKVGFDAEFIFARPWTTPCPRALPVKWINFEISSTGGATYSHPVPLGPPITAPTPNHLYSYPLVGSGRAAAFRLMDDPEGHPAGADNYGQLHIVLRAATPTDCAIGGYKSFDEPSEAACVAVT